MSHARVVLKSLVVTSLLLCSTAVSASAQGFGFVFKSSDVSLNGEQVTIPMDVDALQGVYPSRSIVATCQSACDSGRLAGIFTRVGDEFMAGLTVAVLSGRPPAEKPGYGFLKIEGADDAIILGSGPGGVVPRALARNPVALSLTGSCDNFKAGKAMLVLATGTTQMHIPASTQLFYPAGIPGC